MNRHVPKPSRLRRKTEIVRSLYTRGFTRQQLVNLFRFIGWVMRLPVELDAAVHQTIHEIQEKLAMPYVTSLERIAQERGAKAGFGLGQVALLRSLLTYRFGPLPDWVEARLSDSTPDDLTIWSHRLLDAADLEGVFDR